MTGIFVLTLEVSVGALLQTDGEIRETEVSRGAGEAAVLARTCTRLAGLVTGPTHASLAGEAARRAARHAGAGSHTPHETDKLRNGDFNIN